MKRLIKGLMLMVILVGMGLNSCAYYNTFYNAEQYYDEAQKLTRDSQLEKVSKQEKALYSKAIEKSRKLLRRYPESKYRDDAQFLIAKSYYFKGDYATAQQNFEKLSFEYSSSPFASEVPLWIGRCLLKRGDLEMARHEASRVMRSDAGRDLQADALLMMGEIAVKQDSLMLAENYLEQVIETSPDGFTKAKAKFQLGMLRENQQNYSGALEAYKGVSRYRPSESLKIEAIIRQTSMLKALDKDSEAVEMIQDMLQSDRFVEIRGELELELAKLYISLDKVDLAESKLSEIVKNYSKKEVAAEADYILGDLLLTQKINYKAARKAFSNIKLQASRSPYVAKGNQRIKQIDRYEKIQTDLTNLKRQLEGLPPLKEKRKNASANRKSRGNRERGRSNTEVIQEFAKEQEEEKARAAEPVEVVEVSYDDSARIFMAMAENRYELAEYMLFEFARVDTSLEILRNVETSSMDSSLKHRAAYMQYYALESIKGDTVASNSLMSHIFTDYPDYYKLIHESSDSSDKSAMTEIDNNRFQEIAELFENGNYSGASKQYLKLWKTEDVSTATRSKACFNYGWLNDNFLYNRAAAIEAYTALIDEFPDEPLHATAKDRLKRLTEEKKVVEETEKVSEPAEEEKEEESSTRRSSRRGSSEKEGK